MPVPTETLRNIKRLNVVFALSALAGAGSMAWMLWSDFNRPWRHIQTRYFDVQAALAHFEYLGYHTQPEREKRRQLAAAVEQAERKVAAQGGREAELLAERDRIEGELAAASLGYGNLKAQIQVTAFQFEELKTLHGEQDARTVRKLRQLEREREELVNLTEKKDTLEDRQRDNRSALKALYAELDEARRKLAAYDKQVDDASNRDRLYGNRGSALFGLVPARVAFNFPGLDFLAPKGTPGRQEIRQVVTPSVRVEMNFLDSYATDRCTTCHVAIDDPAMTRENFADKLETALHAINEKRVAAGQPPLEVGTPEAEGSTKNVPVFLSFDEMDRTQKDAYLSQLAGVVNEYLRAEGRPEIAYGQPLLAHPDLDLYVTADSPHPMGRMGCTACHEGNGQETDFVLASHTPASHEQEHEWAEKYYVRELGVPNITFHVAHEFWERPMLLPQYTSASCAKCHTEVADLERRNGEPLASARAIVEGRRMFTTLGCINCHAVEGLNHYRRVGPDLTHVASKLSEGFMHRWIEYPKRFRPGTWMPHYFHQENNLPSSRSDEDPDPILRTETEILAISHYLRTFSRPFEPMEPPSQVQGDAARGEQLVTSIGCLACHTNLSAKDPNDEAGRTFAERWIVPDLIHAGATPEEAAARFAAMTLNERVDYAVKHLTPERRTRRQAAADAERLAAEREGRDADAARLYVPAAFTRFAPELSGIGTKLVPNADNDEQVAAARRWLYDWLRDPRHYSSYTKMPRMFRDNYYWQEQDSQRRREKNDQDILDIAEYLLSLRHDTFRPDPIPADEAHRAETQRLIRLLLAGQNTDSVATAVVEDRKLDPGDEYGLLTERIIKGVARSLGEGEAGVTAAAEIVGGQDLAGRQLLFLGSKMITHYGCYACHQIAGFETASRPGTELTTWGRKLISQIDFAFFATGFHEERVAQPERFGRLFPESAEYEELVRDSGGNPEIDVLHTHASFAYHKMRNPRIWDRAKLKSPYEKLKMPNFFFSEDEARSLTTFLLSRQMPLVRPDVQIDYASTPAGWIAAGRHLVNELNCIGCHAIDGNQANVHQYFMKPAPGSGEITFDVTAAPPSLYGEGAKIQFPWLFRFLNNVEMLRPWLAIRMPSFYLDHGDTTRLVDYFVGLSQEEADALADHLRHVHKETAEAGGTGAAAGAEAAPGGEPWFLRPALRSTAEWLARFALRNRLVTPYDLDTSTASSQEEAIDLLGTGFDRIQHAAEFLRGLFDVTYPFVEGPRPDNPPDRYERGRKLLWELKCLACHVAGDPFAPGTTLDIKAPNFALTHQRLRYDWVRQWLINPQLIQPGTNMPQLFSEGLSAFKDFPPDRKDGLEAEFGATGDEQIRLLTDFLYDMGARNETVVQPAAPEPPAGEAPPQAPAETEFESEFDEKEPAQPPAEEDDFEP